MHENNKTGKGIIILLIIMTLSSLAVTIALLTAPKPEYTIVLGVDELNSGIKKKDALLIDLRDEGYRNLNYVKFGYEDYVNSMGSKFKPIQGECPCKNYS